MLWLLLVRLPALESLCRVLWFGAGQGAERETLVPTDPVRGYGGTQEKRNARNEPCQYWVLLIRRWRDGGGVDHYDFAVGFELEWRRVVA
jgi:hypothetical protein